ncbi:hypothetical protein A3Q56_01188 [Intoshia linei]|uniref:Uncharacterized protein n=1 Tax=Intoshia linei TaxID=1819745 RepID=A0A177B9S6_9BILA|nr:hypothetical protein A3Q56_01188 [Intoshia linei]
MYKFIIVVIIKIIYCLPENLMGCYLISKDLLPNMCTYDTFKAQCGELCEDHIQSTSKRNLIFNSKAFEIDETNSFFYLSVEEYCQFVKETCENNCNNGKVVFCNIACNKPPEHSSTAYICKLLINNQNNILYDENFRKICYIN